MRDYLELSQWKPFSPRPHRPILLDLTRHVNRGKNWTVGEPTQVNRKEVLRGKLIPHRSTIAQAGTDVESISYCEPDFSNTPFFSGSSYSALGPRLTLCFRGPFVKT